ncbi:MAG: efflux RND transporter periplasmic adaptor subunit [Gammaproteobacteria bacterium]|nr:efflux RND transporter periplasmic adaptor subunit [Gammaproteobacteria bacterium]MBU0849140.1 efflux RND transporter periplasmic adaptor subunit [Gammaproteobacteria bacterium]MBU1267891.1 efflux RND transporter periplasmic adaptor subunit [Gammaproteobacteria bacterium]MBU1528354.1 efflux RND transporter periplasmic adaptor subunit [Gammaproteobacteria bacterium]MBU1781477.1 efflux RND transporter periplasmic adaptor subunit [Gammaproteobacteria bacterium]
MKKTHIAIAVVALAAVAGGGYGLWALGMNQGMEMMSAPIGGADDEAGSAASNGGGQEDPSTWNIPQGEAATRRHMESGIKAGDIDPETGLAVQYYHDPMVPGRKFDSPGKSPFMDMMLVPAYSGADSADSSSVKVSPRIQQNLGIRTAAVSKGMLAPEISASGSVQWNERERVVIQSRAMGYVERLNVTATLDAVKQGQTLLTVYVPDWIAAQEEFLSLRRMKGENLQPLIDAARQRMLQVGMNSAQIQAVERSGTVQARLAISAPRSGVVTELTVREGMTVQPGMTLVEINGLSTVWVQAEVPEVQAVYVRPGANVVANAQAVPGRTFEGTVQAVLPQLNSNTRTVLARIVLKNPEQQLLPGMFVQTRFFDTNRKPTLIIPSEAVIQTGRRAVVMLSRDEGRFMPVEIKTGIEFGGQTEVLEGLEEGQKVVLSGQFLIDSEASLRGLETRLNQPEPGSGSGSESATHSTPGVVESVSENAVTVTHPPVPSLGWPEMTMEFRLPEPSKMPRENVRVGDQVNMEFRMQEGDIPQIVNIQPINSDAKKGGGEQ